MNGKTEASEAFRLPSAFSRSVGLKCKLDDPYDDSGPSCAHNVAVAAVWSRLWLQPFIFPKEKYTIWPLIRELVRDL